jgi:hypothetical protein
LDLLGEVAGGVTGTSEVGGAIAKILKNERPAFPSK